jgi:intracellular sulfur oxidation DsrE/DsrF family protein
MKKSFIIPVLLLFLSSGVSAVAAEKARALQGQTSVNIVCDMNVGEPKLLLKRMELLDTTYRQIAASGAKTNVVVAVRGKASYFFTKGDDYVPAEAKDAKVKARSWIEKFKKNGFIIEQCAIAAEMHDIDLKDFLPQVEIVENGYVSLIGYQHQGYAYLPMD